MRWLAPTEVPTLGHWFRAAGYDTHYDGKWHISHADLIDELTGKPLATNTSDGTILQDAVEQYLEMNPLNEYGFSGWVGPEPHGALLGNSGFIRDPLIADRTVRWLEDRYRRRNLGDSDALKPFLLVVSFWLLVFFYYVEFIVFYCFKWVIIINNPTSCFFIFL